MKKDMLKYVATAFVALGLVACSEIAEEDRIVYEPAKLNRNVLLEDFTGQRCVNCPNATEAIHQMQEVYGDKVIAVAIHCGKFGVGGKNGLMTEEGKEYWNHWFDSTQGQPVAKINRGNATNDYQNWSLEVATKGIEMPTDVQLDCNCFFLSENNKFEINVFTKATAGRKANLQVWLTEDNIVAAQIMPDNSQNSSYVHNHVFRTAVNGTWGEEIVYREEILKKTYNIELNEKWNADNMHAVIFVYDEKEVLNVIQIPIK